MTRWLLVTLWVLVAAALVVAAEPGPDVVLTAVAAHPAIADYRQLQRLPTPRPHTAPRGPRQPEDVALHPVVTITLVFEGPADVVATRATLPASLTVTGPQRMPRVVECDAVVQNSKLMCTASVELPVANANGVWTIEQVTLGGDERLPELVSYAAGMRQHELVHTFMVINAPVDVVPPVLLELLFVPRVYYADAATGKHAPGPHVCIAIEDLPSGLSRGTQPGMLVSHLRMRSTAPHFWEPAVASFVPGTPAERFERVCSHMTLPEFDGPVHWEVEYVMLVDDVGNTVMHSSYALAQMGAQYHLVTHGHNDTGVVVYDDLPDNEDLVL